MRGRITPAGAGKRRHWLSDTELRWDHPRGCGEKWKCFSVKPTGIGSPPRVRGKERSGCDVGRRMGITPAGAGKR